MAEIFKKPIFDSIHGFTNLTQTEDQIVNSLYFQRLRWIRQLGWSHYIYPGATHTRFAHALGVLHVMDKIIKSINRGVDEEKLFNPHVRDEKTMFHRKMRLAGLLHDIGTFPFSHSIEQGYIAHYKNLMARGKKTNSGSHEELGSHIINHTDFEGGLTHILKSAGFDPQEMSELIRGKSDNPLANQLIHSDIDADRIDYLIRDAHFTGVKYGVFDMDYLISNMRAVKSRDGEVLAISESALTAVEYFLISRYTWYSQIINDGTGYKFDLLATRITQYFLENGMIHSIETLKNMASKNPKAFFGFNDSYFTSLLQGSLNTGTSGSVPLSPVILELIEMLMFRVAPKQLKIDPFAPSLVRDQNQRHALIDRIHEAVEWLRGALKNFPAAWVIEDIPSKDVIFTKSGEALKKSGNQDSVRILDRDGNLKLLVDVPNSIMKILAGHQNFIPRVYVNRNTYRYLQSKGILQELENRFSSSTNNGNGITKKSA